MLQPGRNPGQPPIFQRVGIVGLGLIGGSIALAARQIWPAGLVIGVDRKDVLERAMVLHAIDVAADDPVVLAEADLVILAAPIQQNLEILRELADNVTGIGGHHRYRQHEARDGRGRRVASRSTDVYRRASAGRRRARRHRARAAGPVHAGAHGCLPRPSGHDAQALDKLKSFASGLGAVPQTLSPEDHDRLLAFISHLPQLTVSALMHVVGEAAREDGLSLSGRGLQDTTRLASSPADIWKEVCATNADEIGSALDALISRAAATARGSADGEVDRRGLRVGESLARDALSGRRVMQRSEPHCACRVDVDSAEHAGACAGRGAARVLRAAVGTGRFGRAQRRARRISMRTPTRYLIRSRRSLQGRFASARARKAWRSIGAYHSHPRARRCRPRPTSQRPTAASDFPYVIVSLVDEDVRAYRIEEGGRP